MLYFFGVWKGAGHYLHRPDGGVVVRNEGPPFWEILDGFFPPRTVGSFSSERFKRFYEDDTIASLTFYKGWTVLAMWDRSEDTRHACNAAFLIEGEFTRREMWRLAKESYPQIVRRLKAAPKDIP